MVEVARALGDENRAVLLCALRGNELCVCQLTELLGLAPSTVSQHLAVLRRAGLVESRKNGRWVHYRRVEGGGPEVEAAWEWFERAVDGSAEARRAEKELRRILRIPLAELCGSAAD